MMVVMRREHEWIIRYSSCLAYAWLVIRMGP